MPIHPRDFEVVCKAIAEDAGIILRPGKEYLVESRLVPLVKSEGYDSVEGLIGHLRTGSRHLRAVVVDAMTTNETSFFRDAAPFEIIQESVLPSLFESRSATKSLRVWCAASSSGQEPVSLALLIRDRFPQMAKWDIKITATDISESMLERCREGVYSQLEVARGLPSPLLTKYFNKRGEAWQLRDEIREMIEYRRLNLANRFPPMPQMDMVMIRNVLIYFDDELKEQILANIAKVLKPDGFLFLGSTETPRGAGFLRVKAHRTSYYQLAA